MLIPIVDEQDNIITYKERSGISDELYRVTALLVVDKNKNILMTRRALTKKHGPGKRTMAVAGTVEQGETYEDNVIKETQEEIGVDILSPQLLSRFRVKGTHNYFCAVYIITLPRETPFVFDPAETMDHKWYTIEEINLWINKSPEEFVSIFKMYRSDMRSYIEQM